VPPLKPITATDYRDSMEEAVFSCARPVHGSGLWGDPVHGSRYRSAIKSDWCEGTWCSKERKGSTVSMVKRRRPGDSTRFLCMHRVFLGGNFP
jgi:hypothetical protein